MTMVFSFGLKQRCPTPHPPCPVPDALTLLEFSFRGLFCKRRDPPPGKRAARVSGRSRRLYFTGSKYVPVVDLYFRFSFLFSSCSACKSGFSPTVPYLVLLHYQLWSSAFWIGPTPAPLLHQRSSLPMRRHKDDMAGVTHTFVIYSSIIWIWVFPCSLVYTPPPPPPPEIQKLRRPLVITSTPCPCSVHDSYHTIAPPRLSVIQFCSSVAASCKSSHRDCRSDAWSTRSSERLPLTPFMSRSSAGSPSPAYTDR